MERPHIVALYCCLLALTACGGGSAPSALPIGTPGPGTTAAPRSQSSVYAYVTNFGDGTISVIDTSTNAVVKTIGTDVDGKHFVNPMYAAANVNTPYVYFSDDYTSTVEAIDTRTDTVTPIGGGCNPWQITMRPAGRKAYYSEACSNGIDEVLTTANTVSRITVPSAFDFTTVATLYANPVYPYLYLAGNNQATYDLLVYDENNAALTARVGTNGAPYSYVANPQGTLLFVGTTAGFVDEINTATNQVVARTLAASTSSSFIDGIAYDSATNTVYAVSNADNRLVLLDASTLSIKGTIAVGSSPTSIALNAAQTLAYVTNSGDNTVSVIDLATEQPTSIVRVGSQPRTVVIRDNGNTISSACAGVPSSIHLSPDPASRFALPTASGVRLVGPIAQAFDLTAFDCTGTQVATPVFTASVSSGVSLVQQSNSVISLAAPSPLATSATLDISASAPAGSAHSSFTVGAVPAIYQIAPGGVVVSDTQGNFLSLPVGAFQGISSEAIAYDPVDNRIYAGDTTNDAILAFDLGGNLVRTLPMPSGMGPQAIAVAAGGTTLFVASVVSGTPVSGSIVSMTTSGALTSVAGSFAGVGIPASLTMDTVHNDVIEADSGHNAIYTFDTAGNALAEASLAFQPHGVAVDPSTGTLYVSNVNGNSVAEFGLDLAPRGTLALPNMNEPYAMGFDAFDGYLYVANFVFPGNPLTPQSQMTVVNEQGHAVVFTGAPNFFQAPQDASGLIVVP